MSVYQNILLFPNSNYLLTSQEGPDHQPGNHDLIKNYHSNTNKLSRGFRFMGIEIRIQWLKKETVGALSNHKGTRQTPWLTECEAFLFTHEIIDNLDFTLGGTGPES